MRRRNSPRLAKIGIEIVDTPAVANAARLLDNDSLGRYRRVYLRCDSSGAIRRRWDTAVAKLFEMTADGTVVGGKVLIDQSATNAARSVLFADALDLLSIETRDRALGGEKEQDLRLFLNIEGPKGTTVHVPNFERGVEA